MSGAVECSGNSSQNNDLQSGAGKSPALSRNENFGERPHPIEARFASALNELIHMCATGGMTYGDMIGPLKAALRTVRLETIPSADDDAYNAARGLKPMTEEQLRDALELEPGEPIPSAAPTTG
jgi:hypothetical protein